MLISETLLQRLEHNVRAGGRLILAYSGGLDSTVLLHTLAALPLREHLTAIYVDHMLSDNAADWGRHCAQKCASLNVPFQSERVSIRLNGKGVESAAREARYRIFEEYVGINDILLTAHHLDDQAETFLFRLARGAGLDGLCAMPTIRPFHQGTMCRPLLNISRSDIHAYAIQRGFDWVEDESNGDTRFDRNFLRRLVLPNLSDRWPHFIAHVGRAIDHLAESKCLLDEYIQADLQLCGVREERLGTSIDLSVRSDFSRARQIAILRFWIDANGYLPPGKTHIDEVFRLIAARDDAQPCIGWGACEIRRYNQRLYLLPRLNERANVIRNEIIWDGCKALMLDDGFSLELVRFSDTHKPSNDTVNEYVVVYRSAETRSKPRGRAHSQTIKKLFQEYKLEPWLRARVPFIYHNGVLIAVGDVWQCDVPQASLLDGLCWSYSVKHKN